MDRCKITKWEVAIGAPNRENIPCHILLSLNVNSVGLILHAGLPLVRKSQGILEFVREIWNFVESLGNLRKSAKFKKIYIL